jgi:outer membrane receptor for ferrienterochelin and colicin
MKSIFTRFTALFVMMCLTTAAFAQGVTSASINGKVSDTKEALIGANIMAVHLPTGTVYGNSTNIDGLFRLPNMRVGGPYTLTISYTGYNDYIKENVYLQLGQSMRINAVMQEDAITIEGVEVVASRNDIFDGNKTGAETNVSEEQIAVLPTVSRAIGDFARVTPQATIREGNDGFSISLNGSNNRYNAIYLDGAVSNDVFGLAGSGTNGGQTGVSPISVDAVESFQIALAPFDVRLGGFSGGAINAVTRSGSNNTEASVYGFMRNEKLAGLTPTDNADVTRERLEDFVGVTTGFRVGGALIKDKLFYFLNAEMQRDETPLPFNLADYEGDSDQATLDAVADKLRGFGYEPGGYVNNRSFLDSDKITARFDYNISQNHKASIRYGYVNARNLENLQSNNRTINYQNRAEYFENTTNNVAFELNSVFGVKMANNLKIGYTQVNDDRDPYQGEGGQKAETDNPNYFPTVNVRDGSGTLRFGAEPFSTANQLDQKIFTVTDNFEIYAGKHNITIGTHNEFYNMYNLFIAFNYGEYEFGSVNDFLNDSLPTDYFRIYSLRDNVTGDGSAAGVTFNAGQFGFYVQDEYQATDNLKVTLGVRADIPFYGDTPDNEQFNSELGIFEAAGYDLRGARFGNFIKPRLMFSPRLGFNWDLTGEQKTQLRGGVGVFTSRAPLVWVGGAYNNNGLSQGLAFDNSLPFNPQWDAQQPGDVDLNAEVTSGGNIDIFAEDFKLPQVLKLNLALDQKLPWGMIGNLDFIYNKTLQDVAYQNINVGQPVGNLQGGPDDRPVFNRRDEVNDNYGRVILGYNTQEGSAFNATASLTKPFDNGFYGMVAYSYGDSYKVFDGTSSQNSSQWRGLASIGGRNFDQQLSRSDFSQGSRVIAQLAYGFDWNAGKNVRTTFSLFHESIEGQPYSYVYGDGDDLKNEAGRNRELIYIPAQQSDINLVDDGDRSADAQWRELDDFISNDPYLSENRGGYAERNSNRAPWQNVMDFKILQDFMVYTGEKSHQLQLSFDIFNFTNLINKDWGRRRRVSSYYNLIEFDGFADDPATPDFEYIPEFTFGGVDDVSFIDDAGIQSSRWQMQIGLRYTFK